MSRLNMNLREAHGYAYGAGSRFDMRLQPGPFLAAAGVQTDKTVESLVEFFEREISQYGWPDTVRRYLPTLVSGWVKDAFHPLIRLGYGIEFAAPSEIAAGLAYLTITGDDPRLTRLTTLGSSTEADSLYLEKVRKLSEPRFSHGPFNSRYERILRTATLQSANGLSHDAFSSLSRACLEVFDATHDFFALHLVTSSHAFRVCVPYAGANASDLFAIGIAIGYLAIGAPTFARLGRLTASLPLDRLKCATDEHDVKIAYSCRTQAQAYHDPTYEWAAARYLMPRLPVSP
jgi:hypothetical protein